MLQVLVAALIIGFALRRLAGTKAAQHAVTGLRIVQSVSMEVIRFAIRFTPIAVAALIAEVSAKFGLDVVFGVVTYVLTVLAGLAILLLLYAGLAR